MLRAVGPHVHFELLPPGTPLLLGELAEVDVLLDDARFFVHSGRSSTRARVDRRSRSRPTPG